MCADVYHRVKAVTKSLPYFFREEIYCDYGTPIQNFTDTDVRSEGIIARFEKLLKRMEIL